MLDIIRGYLEKRRLPVLKCPECGRAKEALKEEGRFLVSNHSRLKSESTRLLEGCPGFRSDKGIEVTDKEIIKKVRMGKAIFLSTNQC